MYYSESILLLIILLIASILASYFISLYISEHNPTISFIILKAVPANGIVSTILPTAFITPPKI